VKSFRVSSEPKAQPNTPNPSQGNMGTPGPTKSMIKYHTAGEDSDNSTSSGENGASDIYALVAIYRRGVRIKIAAATDN
jgi:hypothetical protein